MKIDVEGAEFQVLLGARRMLEGRHVRHCVFEFGQTTFDMGNCPDELRTYLARRGYRLRNVVPRQPVFPGRRPETARFAMLVATPR